MFLICVGICKKSPGYFFENLDLCLNTSPDFKNLKKLLTNADFSATIFITIKDRGACHNQYAGLLRRQSLPAERYACRRYIRARIYSGSAP